MVSLNAGTSEALVNHQIAAYIGFPIPVDVYGRMESLVLRLREGVNEHQGKLYASVVLDLVDESMDTFFLRPMADIGISPMGEKLVNAGVSSVKKAVGILVQTLAKKISNEEMLPLAEYLWGVVYSDLSKETPEDHAYMASPIDRVLDQELNDIVIAIGAGDAGAQIEERLTAALLEVSEISLEIFFAQPMNILKLGMVMRKAGQMAFEATRAAIRGVIKKVFKGMSEQELRGVARYIRSVRFSRERFLFEEVEVSV